jgi:arylsulfatase
VNALVVVVDDVGFGWADAFGGLVATPNITRLARNGLRYTNVCTTGLGLGDLVAPAGYDAFAVGRSHETPVRSITDEALALLSRGEDPGPVRSWFCAVAYHDCSAPHHIPHHVPADWAARYKGRFDAGWDAYRDEVLARQKKLGTVSAKVGLLPMRGAPSWGELGEDDRKLYARLAEIHAGFVSHVDQQIGRIVAHLEGTGRLDDTLLFILLGDEVAHEHYPIGWAYAGNTPFSLRRWDTHFGAARTPLVVHWPRGIEARGEIRRQPHDARDIVATIHEAAGVPIHETAGGAPMNASFDDPTAEVGLRIAGARPSAPEPGR